MLLDLVPSLAEFISARFYREITHEHVTSWDWSYCLGFTKKDESALWDHVWATPAIPIPGALEMISTLRGLGYTTVGLSSRPDNWPGLTDPAAARKAADRDFPQLGLDYWITVNSPREKIVKILHHFPDARVVVEDNPDNARDIALDTKLPVILFDAPWNRGCISVFGAWARAKNHRQVVEIVMEASRP